MFRVFILAFGALFWAGQAWAVCTQPDGVEGEIVYNRDVKKMQYCDGAHWIGVGWKGSPKRAAGTQAGQIQFRDANGFLAGDYRAVITGGGLLMRNLTGGYTTVSPGSLEIYRDEGVPTSVKGFIDFKSTATRDYEMRVWYDDNKALRVSNSVADGVGVSGHVLSLMRTGEVGVGVDEPMAKLEVEGNIRTRHAAGHRYFELASVESLAGQSCDVSCGVKYCLGAYVDDASHTKVGCGVSMPNRNCICIGR